jgi:hypothetical protein
MPENPLKLHASLSIALAIEARAFLSCLSLRSIHFPSLPSNLSRNCLCSDRSICDVTFEPGSPLREIRLLFAGFSSLKTIYIPAASTFVQVLRNRLYLCIRVWLSALMDQQLGLCGLCLLNVNLTPIKPHLASPILRF